MQALDRIRCSRAAPLARRQACEGEQTVAGFLQAVGDGTVFETPVCTENLNPDIVVMKPAKDRA